MSVKERLKKFIKSEELSVSAFEKSIKAANGYVNSISKSIGADKALSLIREYPSISLEWLLTGKGEMLKTLSTATEGKEPNIIEINPEAKANTLIADVEASAGFGSILGNSKKLEELPAISLPNAPFGLNVAFRVQGDSMHPTIRHFDFVAANQLNEANAIRDGHTYIIIDKDDGVLCKPCIGKGRTLR